MECLRAPLRGLVPFPGLNSAGLHPQLRAAVASRLKMTARYGLRIQYRLRPLPVASPALGRRLLLPHIRNGILDMRGRAVVRRIRDGLK